MKSCLWLKYKFMKYWEFFSFLFYYFTMFSEGLVLTFIQTVISKAQDKKMYILYVMPEVLAYGALFVSW